MSIASPPQAVLGKVLQTLFIRDRPFFAKGFEGRVLRSSKGAKQDGGARRDRTDDLMLAKHALYQLSYGPLIGAASGELVAVHRRNQARIPKALVGPGRLELPTSRLSGVRSNQLSYGPMAAAKHPRRRHRPASPLGSRSRRQTYRPAASGKRNEDGGVPPIF
jgi:hypothetical protein